MYINRKKRSINKTENRCRIIIDIATLVLQRNQSIFYGIKSRMYIFDISTPAFYPKILI